MIGEEDEIRALTDGTVRDFHGRHYTDPRGWDVVAVGDIASESLADAVSERLDGLADSSGEAPPGTAVAAPQPPGRPLRPRHRRVEGAYPYSYVGLGIRVAGLDERASVACRSLEAILGGGLSSRMVVRIRGRLGWAYDVYSMYEPYSDAGLRTAFAAVASERADDTLQEMRRLVRSLRDARIDDEELRRAASPIDGQARTTADNPPSLCGDLAGLLERDADGGHCAPAPLLGDQASLHEVPELAHWVGEQEWSTVVVQAVDG